MTIKPLSASIFQILERIGFSDLLNALLILLKTKHCQSVTICHPHLRKRKDYNMNTEVFHLQTKMISKFIYM